MTFAFCFSSLPVKVVPLAFLEAAIVLAPVGLVLGPLGLVTTASFIVFLAESNFAFVSAFAFAAASAFAASTFAAAFAFSFACLSPLFLAKASICWFALLSALVLSYASLPAFSVPQQPHPLKPQSLMLSAWQKNRHRAHEV